MSKWSSPRTFCHPSLVMWYTLQVPPLVGVNVRGPWMHDGCAETLEEALDGCDGAPHGGRVLEPEQRAAVLDVLRRL